MSGVDIAVSVRDYLAALAATFNSLPVTVSDIAFSVVELEDELNPVIEIAPAGVESTRAERALINNVYTLRVSVRYKVKPAEMATVQTLAKAFITFSEAVSRNLLLYRSATHGCIGVDARSMLNGEFFQGTNQLLTTIDAKILEVS